MTLSRRSFLGTLGAASTVAVMPSWAAIVSPEPQRRRRPSAAEMALLNSNENAYGMFPSAQKAAMAAVSNGNRYPEPWDLTQRLATYHKVKEGQVITGYGSSEHIAMAMRTFTGPGRRLVTANPTFELPAMHAKMQGVQVVTVPLNSNYQHDLDGILAKIDSDTGLVYICNPNNPTASITPRRDLEAFVAKVPKSTYVFIDEAYHHFANSPDYVSFIDKPIDAPNLIVARTFSKVYGMAGMRLGYSVQAEPVTNKMRNWWVFNNGSGVTLAAGMASLNDDAALQTAAAKIIADREAFMKQARTRKLKVIPSQANFVMFETGRPVREMISHFQKQNVAIGRPFPPMEQYVRVSLGLPNEMDRFWQAWDALPTVASRQ